MCIRDRSSEDQQKKIQEIGQVLSDCKLGHVKVVVHRETVCPLAADKVEDDITLSIKESLPSTMSEQVNQFNEKIKSVIEGVDGVECSVVSTLSAGDKYQTITDIEEMNGEDGKKVELPHDGQVWLLDFWATWCPPC